MFRKFFVDEDGTVRADLAEPFDRLLSPNLLEEKEEDEQSKVIALPDVVDEIDAAPIHRNEDWDHGVPAWLRDSQWWDQGQDRPDGYAVSPAGNTGGPDNAVSFTSVWVRKRTTRRRERDLNPRDPEAQEFSRLPRSAAPAPLRR